MTGIKCQRKICAGRIGFKCCLFKGRLSLSDRIPEYLHLCYLCTRQYNESDQAHEEHWMHLDEETSGNLD